MNKKILIGSVGAVVLIVLASLTSVVGFNLAESNNEKKMTSPLFSMRKNQFINNKEYGMKINSNYIGKGRMLNIFLSRRSSMQAQIDRAFKLIESKPHVLDLLVNKIDKIPQVAKILDENNIDVNEFKNQINIFKSNPDLLKDQINENMLNAPFVNDPVPTNLSTSSVIGCIIIVIALLPLFIVLGILIATITIITCLNLGGCFESLLQALMEGFTQGLNIPDYF